MYREFFDYEKIVEVFLYIITEYPKADPYYLLTEANIIHLYKYGRTIDGGRDTNSFEFRVFIELISLESFESDIAIEIGDHRFKPLRNYDEDFLSKSDKECLQEAFDNYDLGEY